MELQMLIMDAQIRVWRCTPNSKEFVAMFTLGRNPGDRTSIVGKPKSSADEALADLLQCMLDARPILCL